MNANRKVTIGLAVGAAVALAVAVGASGAVAVSRALDANEESQAVIEDAAKELGVQPSALSEALENALEARVDEAVEDGRLTEEQGEQLKERIDAGEIPLVGLGHRGLGIGPAFGGRGLAPGLHGKLDAAASYLGLTETELHEQLQDGKTLAEIARDEGKSVDGLVEALVADAKSRIDQAVADGKLSEERAAEVESELEERVTELVNGELGPPWHRFGRGSDWHGGPRAFRGPRA